MNRQSLEQVAAVVYVLLLVVSTVGTYSLAGAGVVAASNQQSNLSPPSTSTNVPSQESKTTQDSKQSLSDPNIQPQISYDPVKVETTLQGFSIDKFEQRKIRGGQYELSGVLDANPSNPVAPVEHQVTVSLYVYENTAAGRTLVGQDQSSILLEPGSIRPYQLNISGNIINLAKHHENTTNPDAMQFTQRDVDDDGTTERTVVNRNNETVYSASGNPITTTDSDAVVRAVRDPYTSAFGFNVKLSDNKTYDYEISINAVDGPDPSNIVTNSITVTDAASTTSISAFYSILKNTRYRDGADVTFVTSYKSTLQRSQKNIYESLALPTRGEYRPSSLTPAGEVQGFAHASSTNGEFAEFLPNNDNLIRITTSTQTVPSNQPQTLIIRYVPPGDGNISVIPIDSGGVPIRAGEMSGQSIFEMGYKLPQDPSTAEYVVGGPTTKTNLAVIQLSPSEQKELNNQGELFLSYEGKTSDSFRLYCQAVITGTVKRTVDACGLNPTPVKDYSNGVIQNVTINNANSEFTGEVSNDKSVIRGLNPYNPDSVYVNVTVKNAGTEMIIDEPINLFKNSNVQYNRTSSDAATGLSINPGETITRTLTLNGPYQGEDVFLTTDLDTGDGTVVVNVTNDAGQTTTFTYDGHQGSIQERLGGMKASDSWTIEITSELNTGQQAPEVNSIYLKGKEIGNAGNVSPQTVTLNPGETRTVTFGPLTPTTNINVDQKITYTAHFYDMSKQVLAYSNVPGTCNRLLNDSSCPKPTAVIVGPYQMVMGSTGATLERIGTQTVNSTECPTGNSKTCAADSNWNLVESSVGSASGTQQLTTQESGVPLNQSLVGTAAYDNNLDPLIRAGVNYPYKNLPGENSEWTLEEYQILNPTGSDTVLRTRSGMIEEYGSLQEAYKAGWTISTRNVKTTVVGTEYDYFRAVSSEYSVTSEGMQIDLSSSDWTRVTESRYKHMDTSKPLSKTRTVDVDTKVQKNDPDLNETDSTDDWQSVRRVEKVVNRNYSAGTIEGYFHSSPGGAWEYNDSSYMCITTSQGCRYTKPAIKSEYWLKEWVLRQERTYRLHTKSVRQDVHEWTRTYYKTDIVWERSLSGTLHKYEGPKYIENEHYSNATAYFHGRKSTPANPGGRIVDYKWTVNGNILQQNETEYSFTSNTISIASATSGYEDSHTFDMSSVESDPIKYHASELKLKLNVNDDDDGSLQVQITNDLGITRTIHYLATDIPNSGTMTIDLAETGFSTISDTYTVNISGQPGESNTAPDVQSIQMVGEADRGSDGISLKRTATGSFTLGLTVKDNNGFTNTTTRTVEIIKCEMLCPGDTVPPTTYPPGGGNPPIISEPIHDPTITIGTNGGYTPRADYKAGKAHVTASISQVNSDDQFYVVELIPGDVAVKASESASCSSGGIEMTAQEINNSYDSWSGVPETEVVPSENPYCVYIFGGLIGVSDTSVVVSDPVVGPETVKKVVWEGRQTAGTSDIISFTINPRVNDVITMGHNSFELQIREVGTNQIVDSTSFDIFFCHALNGDPDVRNTPPSERLTRQDPGNNYLCANGFNSDFDRQIVDPVLNLTAPAPDTEDWCPYNPARVQPKLKTDNNVYCNEIGAIKGEIQIRWDMFNGSETGASSGSIHMVNYSRYKAVGMDESGYSSFFSSNAESYSQETLKLGYSPRKQTQFAENHLLAYYPLGEPSFSMTYVNQIESETNYYWGMKIGDTRSIYDISSTLSGKDVVASPAWSLSRTTRDNVGATYPYRNVWLALDLSGNQNHAPIMHQNTRLQTSAGVITRTGTYGDSYQNFYRGDMAKAPTRSINGPFGASGYRMNGKGFFVPAKMDSKYWNDKSKTLDYGNCGSSDCYHPRYKNKHSPLGGPGWNQQMMTKLKQSDEYTVSMYVKPGPNTGDSGDGWLGDGIVPSAFYTYHNWNGYPFGINIAGYGAQGKASNPHTAFATNTRFGKYNRFAFEMNKESAGALETSKYYTYPYVSHGTHAWPNLGSTVDDKDTPLNPTFVSGWEWGAENADVTKQTLAMAPGYQTITTPPTMKTPAANDYRTFNTQTDLGRGVGWRHIAITAKDGQPVRLYVDGLLYTANISSNPDDGGWFSSASFPSGSKSFRGIYGNNLIFMVGAEMKKDRTTGWLEDWYISEFRIYDEAMTQSQVKQQLVIDSASYNTRTKPTDTKYKETSAYLHTKLHRDVNASNFTITVDGQLNGGNITVIAYPIDNSTGERINNSAEYIRVSYNATHEVTNPDAFKGADIWAGTRQIFPTNTDTKVDSCVDSETCVEFQDYDNDGCPNIKVTCMNPSKVRVPVGHQAFPDFVAKEVLLELDNGTITAETAYSTIRTYDNKQTYVISKRNFWQSPIYYSKGSYIRINDEWINPFESGTKIDTTMNNDHFMWEHPNGTLQQSPISNQEDFETAIGYQKTVQIERQNTLQVANNSEFYKNWEIVVKVQSRQHSQQTPVVDAVEITNKPQNSDRLQECDGSNDIYRCDSG